mgnify:CR=1 FL=1
MRHWGGYVDGLPNISGHEKEVQQAIDDARGRTIYRNDRTVDFKHIKSARGGGIWTDYGREICRRTNAILTNDF